jgi:hypothetical protein
MRYPHDPVYEATCRRYEVDLEAAKESYERCVRKRSALEHAFSVGGMVHEQLGAARLEEHEACVLYLAFKGKVESLRGEQFRSR